eukprot:scaffold10.g2267.t1
MEAPQRAALITGAASGIGREIAVQLAREGAAVTLVDVDGPGAAAVAAAIQAAGGAALAVAPCDLTDRAAQAAAFRAHMERWGRLDAAVLNAGIGESGDLVWGEPEGAWEKTLALDFTAVAEGVRRAVRCMAGAGGDAGADGPVAAQRCGGERERRPAARGGRRGGAILVTASAGGVYPMESAPIYSAAKAACIQLVRSMAGPLSKRHGVSITALCPQFTDTALVRGVRAAAGSRISDVERGTGGRLLTAVQVAEAGLELLADPAKAGTALVVLVDGRWMAPARPRLLPVERPARGGGAQADGGGAGPAADPALRAWAAGAVPPVARLLEVHSLSTDFRAATRVVERPLQAPLPPGAVLVRRTFTAINASDINFSDGRYFGSRAAAEAQLPFAAGFESAGVLAAAADDVAGSGAAAVGQAVATMTYGGFAEWSVVPAKHLLPVPAPTPAVLPLLTSGLTASIALEQAGRLARGETVLVTAAAGGTGHLAVQLAKLAGCRVVASCGGAAKAALLRGLGADRVVDYREESLKEVLKREFPKGVDVVYESVGGETFDTCVNALATRGRLIVIGQMSQYKDGWQRSVVTGLPEKLLWKSAAVVGFFLNHYTHLWKRHLQKLAALVEAGKLKACLRACPAAARPRRRGRVALDPRSTGFVGLESVPDAVDWLQSGRSVGKVRLVFHVYVQIARDLPPSLAAAAAAAAAPVARL